MKETLKIKKLLHEDIPTLKEWVNKTDYEYTLRKTEVIDYCNTIINKNKLQKYSEQFSQKTQLKEWKKLFKTCDIPPQSTEANTVKQFITILLTEYHELDNN